MDRPFLLILAPCATGHIAADNRLDWENFEPPDLHAPILERGSKVVGGERKGKGEGQKMCSERREERGEQAKPEMRESSEKSAFVRDAIFQNLGEGRLVEYDESTKRVIYYVVSADSIGGYE